MKGLIAVVTVIAVVAVAGVHGLARIRDADLPVPTNTVLCNCDAKINQFYIDLAAITKVCANSTVINPDKNKTKQGRSSCIFDKLGCLNEERTKVNWDKFKVKMMNRDDVIKFCKDTNYDTDGGFWDSVGDWLFGQNFDFASLEKALGNFFNCCNNMLLTECETKFVKKYPKPSA